MVAAIHERGTTSREMGGAKVQDFKRTAQPGNSERISAALMPRTPGLRGLLTRKSNQVITPPGLTMRIISAAICDFTVGFRMELKSVKCETMSKELSAQGKWRASPVR